jgi:hypothetical protein
MLARQIPRLRPGLVLLQHPDDLIFREPCSLHLSVLQEGRTLNPRGGKSQWQVRSTDVAGDAAGISGDGDHSPTKTKSPQTKGIVERFHKTLLDEFYRVVFRKKIYGSIAEPQDDLDSWVQSYNEERAHQGRWFFGKTPMQTFLDATPLATEKMIAA